MQVFNEIKKHRGFIARVGIFSAVLLIFLVGLSGLLKPKEFMDTAYPSTSTMLGFYKLPEDTLDVLFLGSSHAINGFDTQKLYNDRGIRSYVLGTSEQNVAISYFLLKEALKTQKPQAVVLETLMVFPFRGDKVLHSSASSSEKVLNFMKPGPNKYRAIYEVSKYDDELDPVEMTLPFLRYHERWDDLEEDDLLLFSDFASMGLHGFNVRYGDLPEDEADYESFDEDDPFHETGISPVITEYLDRIVRICEEHGIKLLFVKTPSNKTDQDEYNAMMEYADSKGIGYLDFNEEDLYEAVRFDFEDDMGNIGHANLTGAGKITDMVVDELLDLGVIPGGRHEEWESTRELYEDIKANFLISTTDSWDEYFSYLDEDRYTVFMLSDETGEKTAYVKNSGEKIFNRTGDIISGKLPGSMKRYRVVNNEEERSIEINGKERAEEAGDVNIAVYDSVTRDVFDVSHSDESGKIIHD